MKYDVIIVGAGISGLTAAAFLARGGAKVLVCEQADKSGGLFSSFWHSGYCFDGGIKAIENSSVMMPMLAQLGLLDEIQFEPSPVALIAGGKVQVVRNFGDIEAYFRILKELYQDEAQGLDQILRDTKTIYEIMDGFLSFPIPFFDRPERGGDARSAWIKQHGSSLLKRSPKLFSFMHQELRPYLQKYLHDLRLINLLSDLFPDGTSVFFGLGYFRMFLDYYYPHGGIQVVPQALENAIQRWGGAFRFGARVTGILLRGQSARGVRLANGEEIEAEYTIAASDLRQTLTRLVPEGILPKRFEHKLQAAKVSHSVFNVFLGLDQAPETLNFEGCAHVFYHPDMEGISEEDRINRDDYFTHVPQELSIPCMHQSGLAPEGKTGLVISAMTSWQFGGGWDRPQPAYQKMKDRATRELIMSLEKHIPRLGEHIEVCLSATPLTIANRTSNSEGAIMGWSYHRGEAFSRGSFLQMNSSVYTPISRLLTAGHWTYSPGGSPVAVLTGKLAAEAVLHKVKQQNGEEEHGEDN